MARPIEFNRPKTLNRALALFWRQGYQATSLADLLVTMGIGRSSFYAAFTDKRSLFIECLDLFSARTLELLQRARADMPPVDALQHFFERSFVGAGGAVGAGGTGGAAAARGHWGCLLVNTVLEMAGVDDDLSSRASRHLSDMQRVFQACLQDAGATTAQAEELAAMLMLLNEGIRVSSRRRLPDAQHLQPIATTLRLIQSAIT